VTHAIAFDKQVGAAAEIMDDSNDDVVEEDCFAPLPDLQTFWKWPFFHKICKMLRALDI
jgi:predicted transcriptional regulator